ncbi:MAG: transcriptional regulator [Bacteroidota bacterium]|nr:transcriptional regulator [Bacteroidota bacterium]
MDKSSAEKDLLVKLGERIREVRIIKKFSQMQLAALSNSEKSNISRLESGKLNPTIITLKRIADILRVSVFELLPSSITGRM